MLRFNIVFAQDAPFPELTRRWQEAEQLGFNALYLADSIRDWRGPGTHFFECWTTLAAMAQATSTARIGTLVSNPVLRPAATLAKAAVTVDHLSGGRLDLGIGTGIAEFDHAAAGVPYWPIKERVQRFREYVEIVDGLLRATSRPFDYQGRHLSTEGLAMSPPPVQEPRPPIIVAGQSPTVRRVAAERAEVWNTHGPFGASVDEVLDLTRRQNDELDRWCEDAGRQPSNLRRSLLVYQPPEPGVDMLSAWDAPDRLLGIVERFAAVGITDFVLLWPENDAQRRVFDKVVTDVLPRLR